MKAATVSCAVLLALASLGAAPLHARPSGSDGVHARGVGIPDLARGKRAAANGDYAAAEGNFLPLARRGYIDAQLALARLYAHMHTYQATQKAIHWYRVAAAKVPQQAQVPLARLLLRQDRAAQLAEAQRLFTQAWDKRRDPQALAGLIELYTDHPGYDTRHRMPSLVASAERLDLPVTIGALISWYRNTPDMPGHRARLLAMCRRSLNLAPTCYVDLLRDARARNDRKRMQQLVAAGMSQFRQGIVSADTAASMARALVETPGDSGDSGDTAAPVSDQPETDAQDLAPNPSAPAPVSLGASHSCSQTPVGIARGPASQRVQPPPPDTHAQPDLANRVIATLVAGSARARVEAAGVVVSYPFLAPDFDAESALQKGRGQDLSDATLYLGELYLDGDRATRQPRKALKYLQRAAHDPATAVAAQYYIGRLYQLGYLDEVAPQRAFDHLLYAARRGYVSADKALARLFASGKGVCPNHVYAYVFAQLGAREGASAISTLVGQLNGVLTPRQRVAAQRLLRREKASRQQLLELKAGLAGIDPQTP